MLDKFGHPGEGRCPNCNDDNWGLDGCMTCHYTENKPAPAFWCPWCVDKHRGGWESSTIDGKSGLMCINSGWDEAKAEDWPKWCEEQWSMYCYIAGMSCSGEHDPSCYDEVTGHWALANRAYHSGISGSWSDIKCRRWIDAIIHNRPLWISARKDLSPPKVSPGFLSPIEQQFWDAHLRLGLPQLHNLVFQYSVGRFRADFALPERKICIELDGFATHSGTQDIENDRKRQRWWEAQGWRVIRFGGREVHRDAEACVREAASLIQSF